MSAVGAPRVARHPSLERLVVAVLCRFLPAGFRPRQRAEWTGDLIMLAEERSARWRYLAGAAWTLPQLRAAARHAGGGTPAEFTPASPGVRTMAWLLIFGLGLPVLGWFVACLGPYVLLDMPGRIAGGGELPFDPKDVYPTDGVFIVLEPVWIAMFVLGWLAMLGLGPLFGFIGFVALVVAAARRRVTWQHRLAAAGAGVALLAAAFGAFLGQSFTDLGGTAALLGLLAGGLGVAGRGLPRGQRIALCVLCGAALAVFGVLNSPMGDPLLNWYQD